MIVDSIEIRELRDLAEIKQACAVQQEVWGTSDLDVVPFHEFIAARDAGGTLIGAFLNNPEGVHLIGFVYGFVGCEWGQFTIHSHLAAVKPEFRNLQIGYRLKLAQREVALSRGITLITWTFDPLQSLNAHFNFARLGVVADIYKVNYYGDETSILLPGLGTDRFWVKWELESPRVRQRLKSTHRSSEPEALPDLVTLIRVDKDDSPKILARPSQLPLSDNPFLVEIPEQIGDLQAHRPELAAAWREATRSAFTEALAAGYKVVEFFRRKNGERRTGAYLLTASSRRNLS